MSFWKVLLILAAWAGLALAQKPAEPPARPQAEQKPFVPTPRIRPACPIRLGGIFTLGLGEKSAEFEESATLATKLSADNAKWIAANCDVVALNAINITPDTFRAMYPVQPLITPLLLVSATSIYEQEERKGNVGGWKPEMEKWTLRDSAGKEIPHPVPGGHWMDFAHKNWAAHWREHAIGLVRKYGAQGVVASQLPLSNVFAGDDLARYKTPTDFIEATGQWLHAVRAKGQYLMVPSAIGFDSSAGRPTLPTPEGTEQPNLPGRLWDEYFPTMDGAWAEGWIHPYWMDASLPEDLWEIQIEAADRAARNDQVFIAAAAYHNDAELEFALASYLLANHRQGRLVFQPMPLLPDERLDAGYSLALYRKIVAAKSRYFNVPLGVAFQERHPVPAEGGQVWRRAYQYGVVYVNSGDRRKVTVTLGGEMERVNGQKVRQIDLPPHSGVILLYSKPEQVKKDGSQ